MILRLKNHLQILKLISFYGTILVLGYFIITSFNPYKHKQNEYDRQVAYVVTQWYHFFLNLDERDLNAHVPVSSDRLAQMGVLGQMAYDHLKSSFESKDLCAIETLNNVYFEYFTSTFPMQYQQQKQDAMVRRNQISLALFDRPFDSKIDVSSTLIEFWKAWNQNYHRGSINTEVAHSEVDSLFRFKSENEVLPEWGQKPTILPQCADVKIQFPYHNKPSFYEALYNDAMEVYTTSLNLSNEDKWVAEFWSDDVRGLTFSPSGRWISITNQIIQQSNMNTKDIFELYFRLGVGLNDAAILCWKYKYQFNLQRPSSFINRHIDAAWQPFHQDPNFPAFPSGHSVMGAVASTILEKYFGEKYKFTDKSHQHRIEFFGKQRSYGSINEMALENAYSRMLIGVHYKIDCEEGLNLGYKIGQIVNEVTLSDITKSPI